MFLPLLHKPLHTQLWVEQRGRTFEVGHHVTYSIKGTVKVSSPPSSHRTTALPKETACREHPFPITSCSELLRLYRPAMLVRKKKLHEQLAWLYELMACCRFRILCKGHNILTGSPYRYIMAFCSFNMITCLLLTMLLYILISQLPLKLSNHLETCGKTWCCWVVFFLFLI